MKKYIAGALITALFSGCMSEVSTALNTASSTMHTAQQALGLGQEINNLFESTEIDAAVSKKNYKEIKAISKVALNFNTKGFDEDIKTVMADGIGTKLLKLNLDVLDRAEGEKISKEMALSSSRGIINLSKFGVDALVTGNLNASDKYIRTTFSSTATKAIQNASLKVISTKNAKTLMSITLSYKKGQSPAEAAKSIATVLKAMIENPQMQPEEAIAKVNG